MGTSAKPRKAAERMEAITGADWCPHSLARTVWTFALDLRPSKHSL